MCSLTPFYHGNHRQIQEARVQNFRSTVTAMTCVSPHGQLGVCVCGTAKTGQHWPVSKHGSPIFVGNCGIRFHHDKWVCLKMVSTPLYPMVLLMIIPMKNGYFIGNIPYFQTNPNGDLTDMNGNINKLGVSGNGDTGRTIK